MAVWSYFVSAATGRGTPSGQLIKSRLAITTTAKMTSTPAAWPYVLNTSGDVGAIPYFDVPAGWPKPSLPGP